MLHQTIEADNYQALPATTRVWIYQSNQPFSEEDIPAVRQKIKDFVVSWASHGRQLHAFGDLFYKQFVVLMVDENAAGASGCSIDSSVYFLKGLQAEYQVDLFDRMTFTYLDGEAVKSAPRALFRQLYQEGKIDDSTKVFDTLVNTKADFEDSWIKPLSESWHKRMV